MQPSAAQTQALDRIRQASNILVTVSANPSVDQLAACIGLTLLLNRMDKHTTAVFSGRVPSTIEFLQPEKTLEATTDSLRDFIISLDKNKADKLRYKVEDQFVRIFITPYRTKLTDKDLVFSEGDFNVEVVIALGVHSRNELDAAITAHGRILHDATTISVVAGQGKAPDIGQINWQDNQASSLCEIVAAMSDSLGENLIDNQMATAFLTGIVAETARFSNTKTSPRVMSVSAKLMSAGANQQLIISKLEPPEPPSGGGPRQPKKPPEAPPQSGTGVLSVSHRPEVADTSEVEIDSGEIRIDEQGNIVSSKNANLPKVLSVRPVPDGGQPAMFPTMQAAPETPAPGPHDLLDPSMHQPSISSPFTADTQPGGYDLERDGFKDPLSDQSRSDDRIISRPGDDKPVASDISSADDARHAVNQAISTAPFDPAGHPLMSMGSKWITDGMHPDLPKIPGVNSAPPPPVAPPFMSAPGAVVPDPGSVPNPKS